MENAAMTRRFQRAVRGATRQKRTTTLLSPHRAEKRSLLSTMRTLSQSFPMNYALKLIARSALALAIAAPGWCWLATAKAAANGGNLHATDIGTVVQITPLVASAAGWGATRWGMTASEVATAMRGATVETHEAKIEGLRSKHLLRGIIFNVAYIFRDGRLIEVQLRPDTYDAGITRDGCHVILNDLYAKYDVSTTVSLINNTRVIFWQYEQGTSVAFTAKEAPGGFYGCTLTYRDARGMGNGL
jgi:hypothetical protein